MVLWHHITKKESSMVKKLFAVRNQDIDVDLVLLIIRLVCGYAFMVYGWGKIQNPFGWMGPESTLPGFLQGLAAISEFGGGLALILGLLTRLGALGIGFTMIGAIIFHAVIAGDPFINLTGGPAYAPAVIYLLIAILFIVMGPGRFSLDKKIFGVR